MVVSFSWVFWSRCGQEGVCPVFWAELTLSFQLIYEASLVIFFLLAAYGWKIRKAQLDGNAWRNFLLVVFTFYVMLNVLYGMRNSVVGEDHLLMSAVLYSVVYSVIAGLALQVRERCFPCVSCLLAVVFICFVALFVWVVPLFVPCLHTTSPGRFRDILYRLFA